MAKIKKVVATVWYDKQNMHDLRQVFPEARFVYVDFFDKKGWHRKSETLTLRF